MFSMPGTTANPPTTPPASDELDDLFDYNVDHDDVFRDVDTNMHAPKPIPNTSLPRDSNHADSLGIDEAVKIEKKRAPIAKLDEARLLSQAGIPKLRRITKQRLRFKGKGHEFSDVARLLQHYQLWLDELYPRAKFADGLAIIEKLGHSKRMQIMRREWIDEGKPRRTVEEEDPISDKATDKESGHNTHTETLPGSEETRRTPPAPAQELEDDLYSAIPGARQDPKRNDRQHHAGESLFISDDEDAGGLPEEDELDALLAEDEHRDQGDKYSSVLTPELGNAGTRQEEDFDDEMEAMAGMDDMW